MTCRARLGACRGGCCGVSLAPEAEGHHAVSTTQVALDEQQHVTFDELTAAVRKLHGAACMGEHMSVGAAAANIGRVSCACIVGHSDAEEC